MTRRTATTASLAAALLASVAAPALAGGIERSTQSLGILFTNGFARSFPTEIIVGIVGTVILALVFDAVLVLAGRLLMPWTGR